MICGDNQNVWQVNVTVCGTKGKIGRSDSKPTVAADINRDQKAELETTSCASLLCS